MLVKQYKLSGIHRMLIPGIILLLFWTNALHAAGKNSWDQWLDNAYQLTWLDQKDIDSWITENEKNTFDQKLTSFADQWEQRLSQTVVTGGIGSYPDKAYRHLAIAHMLLYLRSADPDHLEKAMTAANREILKSKIALPEVAFWYYYIRAHHNLAIRNQAEFVNDIFRLWFDVVLKLESAQFQFDSLPSLNNLRGYYRSIPYLYRNLANLILRRAIVERRLPDIDSLGVIVLNLSQRMPEKGYGQWIQNVVKRLSGPESDDFHLGYTVLLLEAERQRQRLEDVIDSAMGPSLIEQSLVSVLDQYDYLYSLAKTRHGKATATTIQLNLISFVTSRLYQPGPQQTALLSIPLLKRQNGKAWHEARNMVAQGIQVFYELSSPAIREHDWQANGFLTRETYVATMHDLWRAVMYNCMDTGIYYEKFINPKQIATLRENMPLLQKVLTQYLAFFDYYAVKGDLDIVPDNAYFGAVEAAERLSEIYYLAGSWSNGIQFYNSFFARRLEAAEIFPFDPGNYYLLAQRLAALGRLELYQKSLFMLAYRIRNSKVIPESAAGSKEQLMGMDLEVLQQVIPKIILTAPNNIVLQDGLNSIPAAVSNRMDIILKELTDKAVDLNIKTDTLAKINDFSNKIRRKSTTKKTFTAVEIDTVLTDLHQINSILKGISALQTEINQSRMGGVGEYHLFSKFFQQFSIDLNQIEEEGGILVKLSEMKAMRDTLVLKTDHPFHTLLRRFYHEYTHEKLNYLRILKGKSPIVPYSWDSLEKPADQSDASRLQRLTTDQMNIK